jgi:hypothetical protein
MLTRSRNRLIAARCLIVLMIGVGALPWNRVRGQTDPATQPAATQPSPPPLPATREADELPADSPIRQWFKKLADPDPKVREQAKTDLMGIAAGDLPKLRQLVIESMPIAPDQAAALPDIVTQSLLAGEKYTSRDGEETDASGSEGPYFLGLVGPQEEMDDQGRMGIVVDQRLPGFPSYRFLRKGDMILGVFVDPKAPLQVVPNVQTRKLSVLSSFIEMNPAAQSILLQVLRDGELIRVQVTMAPRPQVANPATPGSLSTFIAERADLAETYWNENFASWVGR